MGCDPVTKIGARPGRVGLVAALAAVLTTSTACGSFWDGTQDPNYDYVTACVDRYQMRVDDSRCDRAPLGYDHDAWHTGDPAYIWYYEPVGHPVVPVGQRMAGGTYNTKRLVVPQGAGKTPKAASVQRGGGAPKAGGTVQRGGFGVSGGSKGGSGS
jgi:uncharacterized membrane protein YgcG